MTMNNINIQDQKPPAPTIRKTIGQTTYIASIHFSQNAKETFQDKIKRLLRAEAMRM